MNPPIETSNYFTLDSILIMTYYPWEYMFSQVNLMFRAEYSKAYKVRHFR